MSREATPGQVITFYSYKGGTGRSMALANVACLLARRGAGDYRVLVVDWDLEAPGLHRYFSSTSLHASGEGVIDLFARLEEETRPLVKTAEAERDEAIERLLDRVTLDPYVRSTEVDAVDLMPAGRFDTRYETQVNTFQWEALYKRVPSLIRMLAERFARRYRYTLIDSRTGLTDISGICTMLLPEKLVVVFTPNEQSLSGVMDFVDRATSYRRQANDLRPLVVYPLPSRIENTEPTQREYWRFGEPPPGFQGYQSRFQDVLKRAYDLPRCDLHKYFDEVQLQHAPTYAYGEKVAVRLERAGDVLSLSKSYERFTDWLTRKTAPWEDESAVGRVSAETHRQAELGQLAEDTYARLAESDRIAVRRLLLQLVEVRGSRETVDYARRRVELRDLDETARSLIPGLATVGLVTESVNKESGTASIELADAALIPGWARLRAWLTEEQDFLLWRQRLHLSMEDWERQKGAVPVLTSDQLEEARKWRAERGAELARAEVLFIDLSVTQARRRRWRIWLALGGAGVLAAALLSWYIAALGTSVARAQIATMKSDLRNLVTAQEAYFADSAKYSPSIALLQGATIRYTSSEGVSVSLLYGQDDAWAAKAVHAALPGKSCVIWVGDAPRRPKPNTDREHRVAVNEGEPTCDSP